MAVYKVIKAIPAGSGYLKDAQGNMIPAQDLVPKVGDTVSGEIEQSNVGNKSQRGIVVKISTGIEGPEGNSLIFIPEDYLSLSSSARSNTKQFLNAKNMTIILIIATAVILFFRTKKLKA